MIQEAERALTKLQRRLNPFSIIKCFTLFHYTPLTLFLPFNFSSHTAPIQHSPAGAALAPQIIRPSRPVSQVFAEARGGAGRGYKGESSLSWWLSLPPAVSPK